MTTIKSVAGSPIEEKVSELVAQLEAGYKNAGASIEQKKAILDQVRIDLHAILPSGRWMSVSTAEEIMAEFERLMKEQADDIANDPMARLRNSIRNKQNQQAK